jgi:hypothetical protein
MDEDYEREEELKGSQDGRTFRVGRVLRGTFDGKDETLEPAITRLMLELTHLPYGEEEVAVRRPAVPPAAVEPPSLLRRIASRLHLA